CSSVHRAVEQENYEVKPLLLPSVEQLPDDASVVVLAGPTRPLTEGAINALDAYLKRGGRLLALVGPRAGSDKAGEKLTSFLAGSGVTVGNEHVVGPD